MNERIAVMADLERGGEWLGAARSWMQSNVPRGDTMTWGSGELVQIPFCKLEELALRVAVAAVAAERERWEAALGAVMPADFKDWHQNSAMERPAVAAWVIRNLRDREAHLEGMLSDLEDEAQRRVIT